eukprot:Skav211284  [mRNA]  locus=scaffold2429:143489:145378:+ [translate_table: standard]
MDEAIAELGTKHWQLDLLPKPVCGVVESPNMITVSNFAQDACRPLSRNIKSIQVLFDVHIAVQGVNDVEGIGKLVAEKKFDELPPTIKFKATVPAESKVDIIVSKSDNDTVDVVKALYLPPKVSFQVADSMCGGTGYVPVFRPGPWNIKKGIQLLLRRLGGFQVRWHTLEVSNPSSAKDKWNPNNHELEEGINFINAWAPECDALNEQTFWILVNIKPDSGAPISGWPEAKVRQMCQNKSKGLGGAVSMADFPLSTQSLKPFLHNVLLPYLYPLFTHFGILLLGCPGVGKTPFVITLAMALGRYHVRRSGNDGLKAGWRRAKSLDNFRHKAPQVQEALFLDDPDRNKVNMADLKSFLTCDEDGTVESRYNDARMIRNQMRAYASNDLAEEKFDGKAGHTVISELEFFSLLDDFFRGDKEKDVLAVLKRSIIFMFGNQALYLRLPSEHRDAVVRRICQDDVRLDLLDVRDKPLYGKYKGGILESGPTFDADILREQQALEEAFQKMEGHDSLQDYIKFVNNNLQSKLLFRSAHVVPPSPCPSTQEDDSHVEGARPVPPIGTDPSRRRHGRFVYPDRRLRAKTTPSAQCIEELAEDAEAAEFASLQEEPEQEAMDMEADEEAAQEMGLNEM